ncbi:MAG TPA: gamma-glutamylcyclotransferase [Bacteroidales bacterium]|nr:gamma-glutamylcyclotransferase [Bacteroidales bacterium]
MGLLNDTPYIFVYGTLQSAYNNEYAMLLRAHATFIDTAYCFGELVHIDWYLGLLIHTGNKQQIFGELYTITNKTILNELDEYENIDQGEYIRQIITVFTQHAEYKAWSYIYNTKYMAQ